VLHAYLALQDVLREHGTIDAKTREAIALAVGNQDECDYCQAAHTGAWQAAVDAGWSDEQLIELFTHVTLNLLTNYFNHHVHTGLDGQPAPAL